MNFTEAVKSFFKNYAVFKGRSSRSELWYPALFCFMVSFGLSFMYGTLKVSYYTKSSITNKDAPSPIDTTPTDVAPPSALHDIFTLKEASGESGSTDSPPQSEEGGSALHDIFTLKDPLGGGGKDGVEVPPPGKLPSFVEKFAFGYHSSMSDLNAAATMAYAAIVSYYTEIGILASGLFQLGVTVPSLAVAVRRLHDVNNSGWWLLLSLTIIGLIPVLYWYCKKGDEGENRFGENPLAVTPAHSVVY